MNDVLAIVPLRQLLCNSCRAPLALTNEVTLVIGDIRIEVSLPFVCMKCGRKHVWHPRGWEGREARREKRRAVEAERRMRIDK